METKLKWVLYAEARKELIFSLLTLHIGAVARFASASSLHTVQWSAYIYTGASFTWARPTTAGAEQVGAASPSVLHLDVCDLLLLRSANKQAKVEYPGSSSSYGWGTV
jgi:uncharacterized protein YqjF (DUF2071 family)